MEYADPRCMRKGNKTKRERLKDVKDEEKKTEKERT
jgi:hypothetical protein